MTRMVRLARLIAAAVVAGVLSGIGAIAFHFVADRLGEALYRATSTGDWMHRVPIVLAVPTIGLLFVGIVLQRVPASRVGGVREVLDSIDHDGGVIPLVRVLNVVLSALVLGFGGSVGPEGPMVQLGAYIGSWVGQRFRLARVNLQTLVRAGTAAGVAAAFRSPAGGVLLTLEVFGARFNRDLTAIGIAAAVGYITRTVLLGDAYPFRPQVPIEALPLPTLLLIVPVMGLVAAPTGHCFIRMFERFKSVFPPHWPLAARVALGGFLVGCIGIWFPQVLSGGYPVIDQILRDGMTVRLFVTLLFLKMLATSTSFGSGAVGGLFAPTLLIGALYGGAFGYGINGLAPQLAPQPQLFVLLGMVVMFGSIVKGYWSGLLMVADLSGCYHQLLLPGVIAGGISFFASWEIHPRSIFGLTLDPSAPPGKPEAIAV